MDHFFIPQIRAERLQRTFMVALCEGLADVLKKRLEEGEQPEKYDKESHQNQNQKSVFK